MARMQAGDDRIAKALLACATRGNAAGVLQCAKALRGQEGPRKKVLKDKIIDPPRSSCRMESGDKEIAALALKAVMKGDAALTILFAKALSGQPAARKKALEFCEVASLGASIARGKIAKRARAEEKEEKERKKADAKRAKTKAEKPKKTMAQKASKPRKPKKAPKSEPAESGKKPTKAEFLARTAAGRAKAAKERGGKAPKSEPAKGGKRESAKAKAKRWEAGKFTAAEIKHFAAESARRAPVRQKPKKTKQRVLITPPPQSAAKPGKKPASPAQLAARAKFAEAARARSAAKRGGNTGPATKRTGKPAGKGPARGNVRAGAKGPMSLQGNDGPVTIRSPKLADDGEAF